MATKTRTTRNRKTAKPVTPAQAVRTIRSSAQKALEAGLQAASGVSRSATGAFNSLVKRGAAIEGRSRRAALAKARKARDAAWSRAEDAKSRTVEAVSHLERVFERRVSKAISTLGIPTVHDVRALTRQVSELQGNVDKLQRARARASR